MYRWLSASHSDVLNTTTNSLMGPTERVWVCLSFLIRHTLNVTISQHSLFVCCHNLSITLIFLFKNYKSLISICINPVFGINFLLHPVSLILVTLFYICTLLNPPTPVHLCHHNHCHRRAGFRGSRGSWPRAPTSRDPHQNKCRID